MLPSLHVADPLAARLRSLAAVFLKLGCTAFGGPAVHIAMMEEEVVSRRAWLTRAEFLDQVGATNLIPGPNSTEMALLTGLRRAGFPGLLVAGASFIGPAVLITGALAWAYVTFGHRPAAEPFLYGIRPALIAVVLAAIARLGRTALKGATLWLLAALVLAGSLVGGNEIALLLGGGLLGAGLLHRERRRGAATTAAVGLLPLGLFFLKIGSVLYGSGYVLIAFLQGELVERRHWLTQPQLLDAIAMGQFTPGPLSSTATFIGYLVAGPAGAVVATLGMFLPSFVFVVLLSRLLGRLRPEGFARLFLDAVNAASIALMAAVTLRLVKGSVVDWPAGVIAGVAAVAALRFKVSAPWLVLGGAAAGWAVKALVR